MPLPSQSASNSHEPSWPRFLLGLAVVAPALRLMKMDWNTLDQGGEEAYNSGNYREAERLHSQALRIARIESWSPSQITASLNHLGSVYSRQGYFTRAMLLLEEALSIVEQGPPALCADNHAAALNNLGIVYSKMKRYKAAETCYQKALSLKANKLDAQEGRILCNLGVVYYLQGRYNEAEQTMMTSLHSKERQYGLEHPAIAEYHNNIGAVYHKQGRFEDAEQSFARAAALNTKLFSSEHPDVATTFNNWAALYIDMERNAEAEWMLRRVIHIRTRVFGANSSRLRVPLMRYADLLYKTGCDAAGASTKQRIETLETAE